MARPLRIECAGALYHVTSRGNERKPICRDDHDRAQFLERLVPVANTYRLRVHGFAPITSVVLGCFFRVLPAPTPFPAPSSCALFLAPEHPSRIRDP